MSESRTTYGGETTDATAGEQLIAEALAPAYLATSSDTTRVKPAVDWLVEEAQSTLEPAFLSEIAAVIERLPALAMRLDDGENHGTQTELAESVFLLRGMMEDPQTAITLLRTNHYFQSIEVPGTLPDLRLDLAVASEQLSFAALIREPGRLPAILAAAEHFRRQYRKAYVRHHEMYWQTMTGIESHLIEAQTRAAALSRLNSLSELGPPIGEMALESIASLAEETSVCSPTIDLTEVLTESPVCPTCLIRLDQQPPLTQAEEALSRLDRAIESQLARLSSVAVRETLERSSDPRIERFLRVVQAAQLSTLAEVLDDALTNYLRRFLVETRLNGLLEPFLLQIERGEEPDEGTASDRLTEIEELMRRAQPRP